MLWQNDAAVPMSGLFWRRNWWSKSPRHQRIGVAALASLLLVASATSAAFALERLHLQARLLSEFADELPADASLHAYARQLAEPAYADHCASCHDQSQSKTLSPDLKSGHWIYDFGRVSDLERTILYGIRSGHGKGRNTADMPALGITGQLAAEEIRDVAAYVISLSRQEGDPAAIARGEKIYQGKGQCFDCHGADASGNIDWGTPGFDQGHWLYGGDPDSVYASIHDGRHGRCPAWIGRLEPLTIRALAVFLHDNVAESPPG